jgi:hypothetical protein
MNVFDLGIEFNKNLLLINFLSNFCENQHVQRGNYGIVAPRAPWTLKGILSNKKATDVAHFIFYSFLLQASLLSAFVKNKMAAFAAFFV